MAGDSDLVARLASHLLSFKGGRLPSERELAEYFTISRGQVREALAILEALRVVERRAKSGISLTSESSSIEALALFAQSGMKLSPQEVYEAVEMRKIHEITAVRLACERATLENFDRLRGILAASEERIAAGEAIHLEDKSFHLEIVRATQNTVFFKIVNIFYLMSEKRLPLYFSKPERVRQSHAEHLGIFDAIAKRDAPRAMTLMGEHLAGVESYWQGLIGRQEGVTMEEAFDKAVGL
jgi:DNA-binding FadR family transcriptional regulator